MKILVLTDFKDGRDQFVKDDIRTVSDEDGARFVANGWANDTEGRVATGTAEAGSTDLDIQNSTIGLGDNHG